MFARGIDRGAAIVSTPLAAVDDLVPAPTPSLAVREVTAATGTSLRRRIDASASHDGGDSETYPGLRRIVGRRWLRPPSIESTSPVTQLFVGSRSQQIAEATSSGSPSLPSACISSDAVADASFDQIDSVRGVLTKPGATALTRRPRGA